MTRAESQFTERLLRLTRGIARLDLLKPGDLVERPREAEHNDVDDDERRHALMEMEHV